MNPFFENLAHFAHGAAFMFFMYAAVQLFRLKDRNRVLKFLFWEMVFMAFLELKDMVYLVPGVWDSDYISNLNLTLDMWYVPMTALFLFEILSPGWVTVRRAVFMMLPSVLFTPVYALWPLTWIFRASILYSNVFGLIVLTMIFMASGRYDSYIKRNFSYIETLSLGWVRTVVVALYFCLFIWSFIIWEASWLGDAIYYAISVVTWVFIYYYSAKHSVVEVPNVFRSFFRWQTAEPPAPDPAISDFPFVARLHEVMNDRKLYLNPRLTLSEMAVEIGTNRTYLSDYLNSTLKTTFYEYLNGFRVREAQRILEAGKYHSLEDVAEKSGFNSLSTFRRSFTRQTGTTPARYQERASAGNSGG